MVRGATEGLVGVGPDGRGATEGPVRGDPDDARRCGKAW
jgi:hypothetical protein